MNRFDKDCSLKTASRQLIQRRKTDQKIHANDSIVTRNVKRFAADFNEGVTSLFRQPAYMAA